MASGFASEDFRTKNDLKKAVQSGRRIIVVSQRPDPLGPPPTEPGPFTGRTRIFDWGTQNRFHVFSLPERWNTNVDVKDGVIVKVH